jgi:hypothetical protein
MYLVGGVPLPVQQQINLSIIGCYLASGGAPTGGSTVTPTPEPGTNASGMTVQSLPPTSFVGGTNRVLDTFAFYLYQGLDYRPTNPIFCGNIPAQVTQYPSGFILKLVTGVTGTVPVIVIVETEEDGPVGA